MNGTKVLADTNVFINLSEGKGNIQPHLIDKDVCISVISEIELLGWYKISELDISFFKSIFEDCFMVDVEPGIKNITISLKQKHRIKLPDAIIASTAIFLGIPLITFDKGFANIDELDVILLEL